ncbi:mitotic-spindle organizing protein 1 isoform X1 [Lutra lutra]|uniref:mitotic-spindle organizing protein 1 isoform X1 n=1 Tax=Lutra lutra TaxID=9657 RepID=UPI001FD3FB47|nr:mitotic-spindle organizing protein 1 isoform X1 [Lutra lutra]
MASSSGAGAAAAAAANLNAGRRCQACAHVLEDEVSWSHPLSTLTLVPPLSTPGVLLEISRILNTGLDMETLSICVRLCEQGINPEALSSVIKELRKATEALKAAENMTS